LGISNIGHIHRCCVVHSSKQFGVHLLAALWRPVIWLSIILISYYYYYYYQLLHDFLLLFSLLIIFVSILLFTPLLWAPVHIHLYFNIVYFDSTRRCWLAL
jgi:hypothetical protein